MNHVKSTHDGEASWPGLSRPSTPRHRRSAKLSHVDARIKSAHDDSDYSSALPRYASLLTAAALISGCTYLEQKKDLMTGGLASREAEANAKFQTARTQNQDLQDQQIQLDREIDRNNKRIASAQSDLDRVSAELNAARKRNAVSEADYRRLKSQVDETQSELSSVNMQLDAGRVTGNVDIAGKERQIQALEKKKSQLEKALGMSPRP
jgi:chromosome segregation ATPase